MRPYNAFACARMPSPLHRHLVVRQHMGSGGAKAQHPSGAQSGSKHHLRQHLCCFRTGILYGLPATGMWYSMFASLSVWHTLTI